MSQAALAAEKAIGHDSNNVTAQDITNPGRERAKYGDPNETMKALVWMGKNKVEVIDCPKPKIMEDRDVILKVTGSTVCGSDLHLLHGKFHLHECLCFNLIMPRRQRDRNAEGRYPWP